jgi:hypothetical protein
MPAAALLRQPETMPIPFSAREAVENFASAIPNSKGSSCVAASVNSTDKTGRVKLRYRVKPLCGLLRRIRMMHV